MMYTASAFHITLLSMVTLKSYALLEICVFEKKNSLSLKTLDSCCHPGEIGNVTDLSLRLKDTFGEKKIMGF